MALLATHVRLQALAIGREPPHDQGTPWTFLLGNGDEVRPSAADNLKDAVDTLTAIPKLQKSWSDSGESSEGSGA